MALLTGVVDPARQIGDRAFTQIAVRRHWRKLRRLRNALPKQWADNASIFVCGNNGGMQEVCGFSVSHSEVDTMAVRTAVKNINFLAVLQDGVGQNGFKKLYNTTCWTLNLLIPG